MDKRGRNAIAGILACCAAAHGAAWGATPPAGFADEAVATMAFGTAFSFAPDGRLFVCEQGGAVRVLKDADGDGDLDLLPTPFVTVPANADDYETGYSERGLLGVAFHPDFAGQPYVYVFYTRTGTGNRVSRFPVSGDVAGGPEELIFDIGYNGDTHHGGAMHAGPDDKLYVSVGEGCGGAQDNYGPCGKILRLNLDGTIPTDNPFYGTFTGSRRAIWALGLRNAFTFAFQPGTGRMFINDVGQSSWEEINDGVAGGNYGWPVAEGNAAPPPSVTYGTYRNPLHVYDHDGGGCSVVGGAFYNPSTGNFPASYEGDYFFADWCEGSIQRLESTATYTTATLFATGAGGTVGLALGPDGSLYYLTRPYSGTSEVRRIRYTGSGAPTISQHPQDVLTAQGSPAVFTVSANGTPPLAYQWQRAPAAEAFSDVSGATSASYTLSNPQLSDDGAQFRCRVSNGAGTATSNAAVLDVTAGQPPVASIALPAPGSLYSFGDDISFQGSATDPEQGALPASALSWRVDFAHQDPTLHLHPVLPDTPGASSGTFSTTIPETSQSVWYRVTLTATDAEGLTHVVVRDVMPRKSTVTLATSPAGLQVTLDGAPRTAPFTFVGVENLTRSLGAPSPQSLGGITYEFVSWSDGGAQAHDIATPTVDTTYTAVFRDVASMPPARPRGLRAR